MGLENFVVPEGFRNYVSQKDLENLGTINKKQYKKDKKTLKRKSNDSLFEKMLWGVSPEYGAKKAQKYLQDNELQDSLNRWQNYLNTTDNYITMNQKINDAYENAIQHHENEINKAKNHYINKKNYINQELGKLGGGTFSKIKSAYKNKKLGKNELKNIGKGFVNDLEKGIGNIAKTYQLGKLWFKEAKEQSKIMAYDEKERKIYNNMAYFSKFKKDIEKTKNKVEKKAQRNKDYLISYLSSKNASPYAMFA